MFVRFFGPTFLIFLCNILCATWCYFSLIFQILLGTYVSGVFCWESILKCIWGRCSVHSASYGFSTWGLLKGENKILTCSSMWLGRQLKDPTVNPLHTQDFAHSGFWRVREKHRWVQQTWSPGALLRERSTRGLARIIGMEGEFRSETGGYQGWEKVEDPGYLLLCQ